ncbi:JAB domain-containing protein [Polaribacter sp. Z022]|uniref:JAB domain-containing protein n=1 Tax=Polaribacter sp. Z022 TaxID=2927125 RepID=UPI002020DFD7|nr:JAB domain-containing protein [Polaribacter sp. Z022]MCL7753084.1 JAB domain-containing protein [Polaribacter sp. Z022]
MISTNLSTRLMGCSEIEIHYKRPLFSEMKTIATAQDVNTILRSYINPKLIDVKEFFWVVFLSRANCVLGISTINCGDVHGVTVNIREILQLTLLTHASQIIVAHNHPSGKLIPSKKDEKITNKIAEGVVLFDVKLLDHLIITSESFLSFANEGMM